MKAKSGRQVAAVVLAAGEGKRLKSGLPKVLHNVAGVPLCVHVLNALPQDVEQIVVVASSKVDLIRAGIEASGFSRPVEYVVQDPPLGTGDAVKRALSELGSWGGPVLVANGDSPLVRPSTFDALIDAYLDSDAAAALLTAKVADPSGLGRIVRSGDRVSGIVEDVDPNGPEASIDEINAGAYVFDAPRLKEMLDKVDAENVQGEYYLTDVIGLMTSAGDKVVALVGDESEGLGVNTRVQLAHVDEIARRQVCERWMDEGVTIIDPATTFIDASVTLERDVTIRPFTFLEGKTSISAGSEIGPQVRIIDSQIGPRATVSFAVVRESVVGEEASVGPFASLRAGTRLEKNAKIGSFVETKETTLGEGSKANHLAYLGDAEIGKGVNVGAGTITCNWDGERKHKTVIEDDAYISSDTMLVAPTRIGKRAATGAGAVVKGDVPDDALAVGMPARIIEGKGNKLGRDQESEATKAAQPPEEPRQ